MTLEGKRTIVTGSTKGIGLAIAQELLKQRAKVVVSSRAQANVDEALALLEKWNGGQVFGKACDVRDPEQVKQLIQFAATTLGGLDILINNAGIGLFKSVEEMTPEEWRNTIGTNLDGVFYGCHFAIPELKKSGGGFIINISSLAGKNAFPHGSAYNASKFGLTGFSEALMQEVRYDDIRVAYIMPGSVDTSFSGEAPEDSASWKLSARDVAGVVMEILRRDPRCLTSRIEMRPSKPPRK